MKGTKHATGNLNALVTVSMTWRIQTAAKQQMLTGGHWQGQAGVMGMMVARTMGRQHGCRSVCGSVRMRTRWHLQKSLVGGLAQAPPSPTPRASR